MFRAAKEKEVVLSLADSVGSERPGFAITDQEIAKEIEQMVQEAPYRVMTPLFPSQIKRNAMVLEQALKQGKKIYIEGSLLLENLQTASDLGITQVPKEALIPIQEMREEEDDFTKVFIAFTAEENELCEALESISRESYRYTSIATKDTVIFPSPMIPANAQAIQNLKDRLSRLGAITRSYDTSDVKGSGHANKSELRWMHQLLNAKFFIPVQGYHYMLNAHTHTLREIGMSQDSFIIPENGSIIDISPDGKVIKKQKQHMETTAMSVDGHTLTPIQEVVVQDRNTLSQEGIFIIIVFIDRKTFEVKKSPDIISRGFIYLRESQDLIARVRIVIKKAAEKEARETGRVEIDKMKKAIQKEVQTFLVNETSKRPIIVSGYIYSITLKSIPMTEKNKRQPKKLPKLPTVRTARTKALQQKRVQQENHLQSKATPQRKKCHLDSIKNQFVDKVGLLAHANSLPVLMLSQHSTYRNRKKVLFGYSFSEVWEKLVKICTALSMKMISSSLIVV